MRAIAKKRQGGYTMSDEYRKEQGWALDTTNPYYYKHLAGAKEKYGRGDSFGLGGNTEYGKLF